MTTQLHNFKIHTYYKCNNVGKSVCFYCNQAIKREEFVVALPIDTDVSIFGNLISLDLLSQIIF